MPTTPWFRRALSLTAVGSALTAAVLVSTGGPAPAAVPSAGAGTSTGTGKVTKLLTFVEENHSLAQMRASMPYTNGLAKTYGYASHWTAATHPSLPNYLAIAGGSTYGVADDKAPSSHRLRGRSIFGQALAAGKKAKVYVDGMPGNCALTNGGTRYAVKHNPWAYFSSTAERRACRTYDVPARRLQADITAGKLPNAGMVIPNLCHDAHDCSLAAADRWFKSRMTAIMAGPDWKSGRLAVVLTADEDDRSSGNRVLTVVAHRSQHSHVVTTSLTHYSLTRLYSQVLGRTTYLRSAASAPNAGRAFGLPMS